MHALHGTLTVVSCRCMAVSYTHLFPIVGSVWENEYRHEGVSYALTQHGFARDMDFELMLEPVSYTHLDVYKRQMLSLLMFIPSSSLWIRAMADFSSLCFSCASR